MSKREYDRDIVRNLVNLSSIAGPKNEAIKVNKDLDRVARSKSPLGGVIVDDQDGEANEEDADQQLDFFPLDDFDNKYQDKLKQKLAEVTYEEPTDENLMFAINLAE